MISCDSLNDALSPVDHQLFSVTRDVPLAQLSTFNNSTGLYEPSTRETCPAVVLMHWPNGHPCIEMELYLMWLARCGARLDRNGGSVRQEAVKLSHLVRFCYQRRLNFWEIWSNQFAAFLFNLLKEKDSKGSSIRESNQVIEISDACIRFLIWLQESLLPHRPIADVSKKPHQVCLKLTKKRDSRGRQHPAVHFARNPPPSTRQLKTPMPKESIDALFLAIQQKSDVKRCHPRYAATFPSLEALGRHLEFQRATWEAALSVCLAIGCRPEEVATMKMTDNLVTMNGEKKLVLATKKREPNAQRKVPVAMNLVIKLGVYVRKYRAGILEQLHASGKHPEPNDFLFLNSDGNPLSKETLTRGFARLCEYAEISQRTCLSMFRHRAITSLVAIHLREFCSARLDVALHALNDADYSTILAKVASITGHKNPESLRPYIHLAWEELGAFDTVQAAIKLNSMMLTIMNDLTPDLQILERASAVEKEAYLTEKLQLLKSAEQEMREALEAFRHVKSKPEVLPVLS